MMQYHIYKTRNIEQQAQQRNLLLQKTIRPPELFHDELMNTKNVIQEDQSSEQLFEQ